MTSKNIPILSADFFTRLANAYTDIEHLRDKITKIEFLNRKIIKSKVPHCILYEAVDLSESYDGSVMGRIKYATKSQHYTLQIFADETIHNTSQIYAPKDSSHLFEFFISLKEIAFNDIFDTAYTTNMSRMFNQCFSLKTLKLNHFDTSNVTDMSWMFCECLDLPVLDLRTFDTSKVTDMSWMFANCESLLLLLLDGFDTKKVFNMSGMFMSCKNLTYVNLNHFDLQSVFIMEDMFAGCKNLKYFEELHAYTNKNDKKHLSTLLKNVKF